MRSLLVEGNLRALIKIEANEMVLSIHVTEKVTNCFAIESDWFSFPIKFSTSSVGHEQDELHLFSSQLISVPGEATVCSLSSVVFRIVAGFNSCKIEALIELIDTM